MEVLDTKAPVGKKKKQTVTQPRGTTHTKTKDTNSGQSIIYTYFIQSALQLYT